MSRKSRRSPQKNRPAPRGAGRAAAGARPVQAKPPPPRWEVIGICALLVMLVFAVFGQAGGFGFIDFDDDGYVFKNPVITQGLTFKGIGWAFTHVHADNWHPLTSILHMADWQLYGMWAGGHHLTNVALHAVCAVLLLLTLFEMTGALWRSAFVAAVFAIHPLRAESVAWVSELKDVLSGVFFMLTLRAWVRYTRRPAPRGRYVMVAIWFALGLMSKPMLVTTPCVLLLLDYWPLGRLRERSQLCGLVREKLPLFALAALSCVATVIAQKQVIEGDLNFPLRLRIANALAAYAAYLGKLIYPSGLAALYPLRQYGPPAWQVMDASLILAAASAGAWMMRRREPCLLMGWLWFLGMLVPVIGIMQVGAQAYADRYTYLPEIGLCIAGTWAAADWAGRRPYRRAALGGVALVILCALPVAAWRQTAYWHDSGALWTHTLEYTTDNAGAHYNYGVFLRAQGRDAEAFNQYVEALRIDPAYAEAHNNLGVELDQQGSAQAAIDQYRLALQANPNYADAHNNLGNVLLQTGQTAAAISEYRAALRIDPAAADAHVDLGNALLQEGRTRDAIDEIHTALGINPNEAEAHADLGNALFQQGSPDAAIAEYREALRLKPGYAVAHGNIGAMLYQEGRTGEAIAEDREALRIDPAYATAHNNLGLALEKQGDRPEAIAEYREAARINPGYADAESNLGLALEQEGATGEGIGHLEKALALQPSNPGYQNELAWALATAPQAALRDGARAVQLASHASQATGGSDPAVLRTLAAAYAEAGRFPDAVETAQKALQLAQAQSNAPLGAELRSDIALYQGGKPVRDARQPPGQSR